MLKGILYSTDPERLDDIHICMNQLYRYEVLLNKIDNEDAITAYLNQDKPDLIILDIQAMRHSVLELCYHSINESAGIWIVALDTNNQHKTELHFFKWVNQHHLHQHARLISDNINEPNYSYNNLNIKKIAVPTLEGFMFIESDEIIRFEAKGAYTNIFTGNGRKIISSKNIGEYEQHLLGLPFFRIHQSHLINLNKMQRYLKGRGGTVIMEDGTHIEVASRRRNDFIHLFDQNS